MLHESNSRRRTDALPPGRIQWSEGSRPVFMDVGWTVGRKKTGNIPVCEGPRKYAPAEVAGSGGLVLGYHCSRPLMRMSASAVAPHGDIIEPIGVSHPDNTSRESDVNKSVIPAKPSPRKPKHFGECKERPMAPSLPESHPALSVPFTMNLSEATPPSKRKPSHRAPIKRSERAQACAAQEPSEKNEHLLARHEAKPNSPTFRGNGKFDESKPAPRPANPRGGCREGPPASKGQGKNEEEDPNSWPTCWAYWNLDQ